MVEPVQLKEFNVYPWTESLLSVRHVCTCRERGEQDGERKREGNGRRSEGGKGIQFLT